MKKSITIKSSKNKGLLILKPLAILLDYGADLTFQEIETYKKDYMEFGIITISGSADSIDKSSQEFDEKGIVYEQS